MKSQPSKHSRSRTGGQPGRFVVRIESTDGQLLGFLHLCRAVTKERAVPFKTRASAWAEIARSSRPDWVLSVENLDPASDEATRLPAPAVRAGDRIYDLRKALRISDLKVTLATVLFDQTQSGLIQIVCGGCGLLGKEFAIDADQAISVLSELRAKRLALLRRDINVLEALDPAALVANVSVRVDQQ